ncbi:hypothetical protein M0R89_19805 (plasmid) [Halorussus limi]|uniref:Uncharacterized protein n=1 Tax=Halorussus limi TaxID=2938695 RepID=A0A8U0HZP5_9EURY|nr:hypothetical protein [Halorussus limi]UPV76408.1 hypothetical protein M0R89_19805 [Halorussus limi]
MTNLPWPLVRVGLTLLVLGPPVAIYVYRDRERRGKSRPLALALGLGLLGFAGLFVHFYLRGDFAGAGESERNAD